MLQYLVGIMFHEPEALTQWNRGLSEDYESSTGLFIFAASADDAVAWGEKVGQALLRHLNQDDSLDWRAFGYFCWVEEAPATSCWSHCLEFFQRVRVGEMPNLNQMGSAAYSLWQKKQSG
jgi:hypothetical protein